MSATVELRRPVQQARAGVRVQQIVDATRQAIAEKGIKHFTTSDVAHIAGCSIGLIYRYFHDRWDLLEYVYPTRITTFDQVGDLDNGTVLISDKGEVLQARPRHDRDPRWIHVTPTGTVSRYTGQEILDLFGALTVIHRPGMEALA